MTDGSDLHRPVGEPGSGRVRYGAAMERYQSGQISADVLEIYRVLAAHDGRDPARVLAERGLPLPPQTPPDSVAALTTLVAEIDRYLAALPGTGPDEVRQGMRRWTGRATAQRAAPHPLVDMYLPAALAAVLHSHPALAQAITAAAPHLRWTHYDGYPRSEIGETFLANHAYASIIGEDAPIAAQGFDLGLFLIAPHVLYRDHNHAAPELYAPLTGPHGWRFAPGAPLIIKPAHVPVWNPAFRPHLTKVGPVPFLCIFAWTRDVRAIAEVIPADDWAALEALRL